MAERLTVVMSHLTLLPYGVEQALLLSATLTDIAPINRAQIITTVQVRDYSRRLLLCDKVNSLIELVCVFSRSGDRSMVSRMYNADRLSTSTAVDHNVQSNPGSWTLDLVQQCSRCRGLLV